MAKAHTIGGYPKLFANKGWALTGGAGNVLGWGHRIGCKKIAPGAPGHWIDSQRCSYRFRVAGKWYSCRGYGEGVAATCRQMKNPPRGHR